jgi:hypothetical protein
MNGRMYDAKLGRFLSPDNYIQDPFNTQSFNRYGYVWNNPLIYVDYSGELSWRSIGRWIKKNAKVITIVATIVVAVVATVATAGLASPLLAATIVGASAGFTAGAVGTWTNGGSFLDGLGNGVVQGAIGAVSGFAGGAVGQWAAKGLGNVVIQGFSVTNPVVKGVVFGAVGGAAGGYAGSFVAGGIMTGSLKGAHKAGVSGLAFGAGIGAIAGGVSAYRTVKSMETPFTVTPDGVVLPKDAYIPKNLVESPYRSGSYGRVMDGKFIEVLRIDPGTLPGYKGPNNSHFHLNGGKKHIFDINKWPWWHK